MCVRAADCNIASKETELRQLLAEKPTGPSFQLSTKTAMS